ncbi:hypothetical protein EBS02_10745, partial [bacterium]|nr:hypothetical protein [bacterium]
MNATSPAHYINQFIPDHAQPTETGIVHISPEIYQTIETFGELTLGSQKEISVFSAIKILAKENKEVRDLLSFTSTETGKKIDSMMLEALGDPWFESVLLYRPDMLISKNNAVFTNELEIVCGGFGIYFSSLLQKYFGEQKTLLDTMLNTMANYRKNLNLDGSLAIIGDQNAADYINQRKWLLKY